MNDEVAEFSGKIGAKDLKPIFDNSQFRGLFKRRNYFILGKDTFLIVKISRSKIKSFWGIGKKFIEVFDILTEKSGNYFMVALVSDHSGWVLSKKQIRSLIADGSMSFSEKQQEYKLNDYNLKSSNSFTSVDRFLEKIDQKCWLYRSAVGDGEELAAPKHYVRLDMRSRWMYLTSNATFQFDEIVKSFEVALRSFIADTLMNKYTDETSFQTELDNLRLSLQPTTLIYTNRFSAKLNKLTKDAKSNYQCRLPE